MDLVVWTGPVNKAQVPGATVPGAREHFFTCCGDLTPPCTPPTCPDLANSWLDGEGRRLPRMLAALGVDERDVETLVLGAFSAGGSIVKRLLLDARDRAKVTAVMLSDASYSSGPTAPDPVEGYVRYMVDATRDPHKLFVATTSDSPNKSYGSGSDTMRETFAAASAQSGVAVDPTALALPVPDQPEHLARLTDNVIWADYGMKGGGHGYHPTLAPAFWQNVLLPWLASASPPGPPPGPTPKPVPTRTTDATTATIVVFVGGVAIGYAGSALAARFGGSR